MLIVDEDRIVLTGGDDAAIDVHVYAQDGTEYLPEAGDRCLLTVRSGEETLFERRSAAGSFRIVLVPRDTASARKGAYTAEIRLLRAGGAVHTVWPGRVWGGRHNFHIV